ncbi:TPR-like protein [Martensiomyces pterosporus]|nr:TPR-like protein [Martensiomyces pterosporus]
MVAAQHVQQQQQVGGAAQQQTQGATAENAAAEVDDDLAKTAAQILDSVRGSANPKFKNSEFFSFMQQLADGQATISGDKVVTSDKGKQADQQGIAAASGPTWATEFEKRADELMNRESAQKADEQTPRDGKIFSEEFARGLERNWAEEFEQTLDGPLNESAVSGHPQDMDLKLDQPSSEFIHGEADKDWLEQFKDSIQPMLSEQDREWLDTQKEWETLNTLEASYRATDPELNIYRFQHDNYYASLSPAELKDTIQHMKQSPESTSLGDAILALETSVTQTPQDAEMWLLLGLKQQENEQEQAAIAALRKAISLDPNALDAHLALAVSYTNEGYQMDAYDELHEWIARHDRYKSLVPATAPENMAKSETRKNYVQDLYIQAARMSPGQDWDPDVQIALGVLFNISSEYDKAVDCFNAALSKRPDDYILWNRLGATQAHIGNNKEATSAYFRALELQPSFIRARYNLSLASTNMGQHREAAENCLIALSLQQRELQTMGDKGKAAHMDTTGFLPAGGMSTTIWNALQLSMYMLGEPKLAEACERQDLEAFRSKFDF